MSFQNFWLKCLQLNKSWLVNNVRFRHKCYRKFNLDLHSSRVLNNPKMFNSYVISSRSFSQKGADNYEAINNDSQDTCAVNNDSEANFISGKSERKLAPSISEKFVPFKEEDSEVILDIDEKNLQELDLKVEPEEEEFYLFQKKQKVDSLKLKRGETGVFDIEELVDALNQENVRDLAVIQIPPELRYVDYMVLGTANSRRHINGVVDRIHKLYKLKKNESDPSLGSSEKEKSRNWKVLDLQNIVLHIMEHDLREKYDIETLWTVGDQFDDKLQKAEVDPIIDLMEKHIKYLQELQPAS